MDMKLANLRFVDAVELIRVNGEEAGFNVMEDEPDSDPFERAINDDKVPLRIKLYYMGNLKLREFAISEVERLYVSKTNLKDCGDGVWFVSNSVRDSLWTMFFSQAEFKRTGMFPKLDCILR